MRLPRDQYADRYRTLKEHLESRGHSLRTVDRYEMADIDLLLFSRIDLHFATVLQVIRSNPEVRLIYLPTEPPLILPFHQPTILSRLPFDLIITWNDDAIELGPRVVKSEIGQPIIKPEACPYVDFKEKRLCCAVFSNKHSGGQGELYSVRKELIRFFAKQHVAFDLFGTGWEDDSDPLIKQVYRGTVDSKIDTMKHYKYSLCLENSDTDRGYITEKIFDSFAAGSVPVYLGAPNIADRVPLSSIIEFRRDGTPADLLARMESITEDEYEDMIKAAQTFLGSEQYTPFTTEGFARTVSESVHSVLAQRAPSGRRAFSLKIRILAALLGGRCLKVRDFVRFRRFFGAMLR